jgi:hypothetical protein
MDTQATCATCGSSDPAGGVLRVLLTYTACLDAFHPGRRERGEAAQRRARQSLRSPRIPGDEEGAR